MKGIKALVMDFCVKPHWSSERGDGHEDVVVTNQRCAFKKVAQYRQWCMNRPVLSYHAVIDIFRDWNNSCKLPGPMQAVIVEGVLCLSMRVIYLTISDGNFGCLSWLSVWLSGSIFMHFMQHSCQSRDS